MRVVAGAIAAALLAAWAVAAEPKTEPKDVLDKVVTVVFPKGFLGGYEFEFMLVAVVVALAATGPGRLSLDHAIGWEDNITGIAWASLVLGSAIVISIVTTTLGRGGAELDEIPG